MFCGVFYVRTLRNTTLAKFGIDTTFRISQAIKGEKCGYQNKHYK
jgi:hypothetical protein